MRALQSDFFASRSQSCIFHLILAFVLLFAYACDDGDSPSPDGDVESETPATDGDEPDGDGEAEIEDEGETDDSDGLNLERGLFSLELDEEDNFILFGDGAELLKLGKDAIQLGKVDELDEEFNYDPYGMATGDPLSKTPAGLEWLDIESVELSEKGEGFALLKLTYQLGKIAMLRLEAIDEGRYKATLTPDAEGANIAYFRIRPQVDSEEAFYGLGAYEDQVNHRGKVRAMQLELAALESAYNEAHVPIPFVIGSTGWGLFIESPYPASFDCGVTNPDRIEATFGTGTFSQEGLTFHLYAAIHPLDITKHYYETTGYPLLPARWGLGPVIWRDENRNQEQVENDLQTMRDLDLAASAYWIDRPYATGVNAFDFSPEKFTDAQSMIDFAHDMGFRMMLWHTPYVSPSNESSDRTIEYNNHAKDNGFFPEKNGLLLNQWGSPPIDFTNPDAYEWWQSLIQIYLDMGIEGFKLDYGEDVVPGIMGARNKWLFFDGSDERSMHSLFQTYYHKVYAELLPEDGGFLICRGGTYGDQVNASIIWPGDLDADMSLHGQEMEDKDGDTYFAVGGLPASMIYGLTLGPSGFPFYGSDTGGYRHSPPDKQTFTRWFQQTALSSVMQIGTSSDNVAWEYDDENLFDDEMLGWYRIYTRLHMRLWPYEWTYAKAIAKTGHPIQRSLGLAYPELGVHPWDIYMFGDDLLVAPVVIRDQYEKEVIFPAGQWVDWWTGETFEGNQTVTVDAPLSKLPLYMRKGSIIPMLRPTIDTIAPVAEPDLADSYATTPGMIHPRVVAGDASTFILFDSTELKQEKTDNGLKLTYNMGDEFSLGALFEVIAVGANAPASILDNDTSLQEVASIEDLEAADSGWFYSSELGGSLYIKLSANNHEVAVSW